jgi:subtilisin family serine protease/subtilisin-like proprotein convertase family protein
MSETQFMWQGGRKIAIEADPRDVTIQAHDEAAARELAREAGVAPLSLRPLSAGLVRAELPDRDADMARLRGNNQVVHHVYRAATDRDSEFLITESFFIKFKPDTPVAAIHQYLQAEHLTVEQDLGDNTLLVRVTDATGKNPVRTANQAAERRDVEYAEPNLVRKLQRMFIPADPLFPRQWHLHAPANDGDVVAGAGVFAPEAWDITLGSREIVIAIADDGFDLGHPDFQGPGKVVGKLNIKLVGPDAIDWDDAVKPRPGDYHGTPCAGVALAEHNGTGTLGVAPGCAFLPVRFPLAEMSDAQFIRMFDAISQRADVVSCSWGVGPANAPLSSAFAARLTALAKSGGRRGKGLVICVAAGNNNAPIKDLSNTRPYQYLDNIGVIRTYAGPIDRWIAAHPAVLTISAATSEKRRAAYSSWGPEVCVCAPSNNFHDLNLSNVPGRGVFTTDNEGAGAGSDFTPNSRFTPDFGGTSSATPTVAGVCGLVLSANPTLSASEVRGILERSADKDLVIASDTPVNVAGAFNAQGISPWFGRGKVNAGKAVAAARQPLQSATTIRRLCDARLPIKDLSSVSSAIQVPEQGQILELRIKLDLAHTYVSDLRVELIAPDGAAVLLHDRSGGSSDNLRLTYAAANTPALRALVGRELKGKWTLKVSDLARLDSGELHSWELVARVKSG